jgi:hypothetical protein
MTYRKNEPYLNIVQCSNVSIYLTQSFSVDFGAINTFEALSRSIYICTALRSAAHFDESSILPLVR